MKQTQIGLNTGRALRSAQQDFEGEKVSIHIPEDILKQTTRCDKNFSCLSDGGEHLCKVVSFINNEICFVEFSEGKSVLTKCLSDIPLYVHALQGRQSTDNMGFRQQSINIR